MRLGGRQSRTVCGTCRRVTLMAVAAMRGRPMRLQGSSAIRVYMNSIYEHARVLVVSVLRKVPDTVVVINHSVSLEVLLSRSHMMFPKLAKVPTVDHSIAL